MSEREHPMVVATRAKLRRCIGHWPEVAKRAKVSVSWLRKFGSGDPSCSNPGINQLQRVSDATSVVLRRIAEL